MVLRRDWMLLWLVAVNSPQASESFLDRMPVANDRLDYVMQDDIEKSGEVSKQPVRIPGDEINEGLSPSWSTHRFPYGLTRKRVRDNCDSTIFDCNKEDNNSACKKQRLSKERKAEIHRNLARNDENISAMRVKGEKMKRWFDFLFENDFFLIKYCYAVEGKSISTILDELKGIRRDIHEVVQIRLRRWGGLGGKVFRPEYKIAKEGPKNELVDELTRQVEFNTKVPVQRSMDTRILSQNLESVEEWMKYSYEDCNVEMENSSREISDSKEKMVGSVNNLQSKFNDISLEPIYDQLMKTRAKDLQVILQSVAFPSQAIIRNSEEHREPIKLTKLCFEKSIFQAIQFMYEFNLIDKRTLEEFFATTSIVIIIGIHLVDLFHVSRYGAYQDPPTLILEMEFLRSHSQTAHLHGIFSVLSETKQCHMIYIALKSNITLFKNTVGFLNNSWSSQGISQRFLGGKLLGYLTFKTQLNWDSKYCISKGYHKMEGHTQKIIEFFQSPPSSPGGKPSIMTEYLLNYYVLRFIHKYFEKHLIDIIESKHDYETLSKQIQLIQHGIRAQELIKQVYTYSYGFFFGNQKKEVHHLTSTAEKQVATLQKGLFLMELYKFKNLATDLHNMSKNKPHLEKWFRTGTVSRALLNLLSKPLHGNWSINLKEEKLEREKLRQFFQVARNKVKFYKEPHVTRLLDFFE